MENNKDIGKIFRERLQVVEKTPNPKVWESIQHELQQKKKRRIVPFWMWFAAGILLLGAGSYFIMEQGEFPKTNAIEQNDATNKTVQSDTTNKDNGNATNEVITKAIPENEDDDNPTSGTTIPANKQDDGRSTKAMAKNRKYSRNGKTSYINTASYAEKQRLENENRAVALANTNTIKSGVSTVNKTAGVEQQQNQNNRLTTVSDTTQLAKLNDSLKNEKKEKAIALKMFAEKKPDAKSLNLREYYLFAHGSPSLSNLASNKSLIDSRLDDADTASEIIFNYGLYAGIELTKKWDIRVGINRTELSVRTTDVQVATFSNFSNIEYDSGKSNTSIANQLDDELFDITQSFEYWEIPLEAKYKLYNQRVSVDAIGGVSALFLGKKEVIFSAATTGQELKIGNTKAMKEVGFSANIGLGFNYRLTKNIQFNLEPVVRYQFNSSFNDAKLFTLNLQTGFQVFLNQKK